MGYRMTVAAAAAALGVSVQAVYKRIRSGTIDAMRINKRWMINDESGELMVVLPAGRPRKGTAYVLMNGPYKVMEFRYRSDSGTFKPFEVFDPQRAPLGTVTRNGKGNAAGLLSWWSHRAIPASRLEMDAKLAQLGLDSPEQIPFRNLGLSLSDQYWICPAEESISWHDVNYFENSFGEREVSDSSQEGPAPWDAWLSEVGLDSPDNTSEGVLPKKWLCKNGKRVLLKGSSSWTDQQPFNEAVATALHRRLLQKGEYVPYELVKDAKGDVVASECECFLKSNEEYIPAARILETQGKYASEADYDAIVRLTGYLGLPKEEVQEYLSKVIVCDGIIANADRHLRNFGFVRDIDTLRMRCAPIFDSGNSLWYDKSEDAVARRDWSFVSRPFDPVPNRQLYLAGAMDWLDASALEGFAEGARGILSESINAVTRLDYIAEGVESRIAAVLSMRS